MGAANSRLDEDKALQLCRERKKFVRESLDGRCALAAAHVAYIQSLKNIATALGRFMEPEAISETSLYISTSATPEPLALTEKSVSQISYSSPSTSQRIDTTETLSRTPSPPSSGRFQADSMKSAVNSSITIEERPPFSRTRNLSSSLGTPTDVTSQTNERSGTSSSDHHIPPTPPWDFFGHHPIDSQFSLQDARTLNHGYENVDDIRWFGEEEGMPDLEEEEEKVNTSGRMEDSDGCESVDKPFTEDLDQSYENCRVTRGQSTRVSAAIPSAVSTESEETESLNESPDLTPLRAEVPVATPPTYERRTADKESSFTNKHAPKDFFSSTKEIEYLFLKASESGNEVPRMLEANKVHFRPLLPGKEGISMASMLFNTCFSCGEDPTRVPTEDALPTEVKYLTWHRSTSSQSSLSRNLIGSTLKNDHEETGNLFCMNSGSHVSTLDRLYAWERKLYDEVKASGLIRSEYENKCKLLREQDSKGESRQKVDKTRAVVKDLHSRIRVAIHRIESISKRIEELRDNELQPQLEELIEGLSRMWETMFECHRLQYNIISIANRNAKITIHLELHRQATGNLQHELTSLSSSFTKWIGAQVSYLRSIDGWLHKCVSLQQKASKRKSRWRTAEIPLRDKGPPIFVTCGVWLDKLEALPTKEVANSIKVLASDTMRLLPRQEKNQSKSLKHTSASFKRSNSETGASSRKDSAPEDWNSGIDRFQSSLVGFLDRLHVFALSSVGMYLELEKAIQEAKARSKAH